MPGHTTGGGGTDEPVPLRADEAPDHAAAGRGVSAGRAINPWVKFGLPAATAALVVGGAVLVVRTGDEDAVKTAHAAVTTAPPPTTAAPSTAQPATSLFTQATPTTLEVTTTTTTTTVPASTTQAPTTLPATTVETIPEQPTEPIAPPSDPRAWEEQIQLGGIAIPKLGVDEPLLSGIRLTTLDNGPGHWPGTAMPGQVGNVVVAAHRTSHGAPFRHIDQLVAGDVVNFTIDDQVIEYVVTSTEIVNPDALWIVDPTDTPTATLFACHPPGSVAQRIVVKLELSQ